MNKNELRKIYKQKRQVLTLSQIKILQDNIYNQIFQLDISNIKNIHIFLTLEKFKEIDTAPIIKYFRSCNVKIVVSKSNFLENTLSHYYLENDTIIEVNKYGIPEPINAVQVSEKQLDLVFVPLLISDKQNYRIGYGKGFYDRFLVKCRKDVLTIGLNFFNPISKIEDVNKYDIPLDKIIYPKE
jgi:5-formyltetrahydrofolate cyclo-ligase